MDHRKSYPHDVRGPSRNYRRAVQVSARNRRISVDSRVSCRAL